MTVAVQETRVAWPAKFNEIPSEVFHREDVYQLELARIFAGPQWHPLAHRAELATPGAFKTAAIGEAAMLLVHGDDGQIRVFRNACPHRGTQLETCARGTRARIECPYHRWTFGRSGELLGAPAIAEFSAGFRKEDYGLRAVRASEFCGLVFATCDDDAPPLAEYLGEAAPYIARALGGDGRLTLLGYQKVLFSSNWKAYADNDGYHGVLLHRAFRHLKWASAQGRRFLTEQCHKVSISEFGEVADDGFLQDRSLIEGHDPQRPPGNLVVNLFPVALIVANLDVINVRYAIPRGPAETEVHYTYFGHVDDAPELRAHRLRQSANLLGPTGLISVEDGAVFNRIQVGMHATDVATFQKGAREDLTAPCALDRSDEGGNLVRWQHYRRIMGFDQ